MLENYKDCLFNCEVILKHNKDLKDYKHLIELKHIHTEQMRLECVKEK